VKRRDFEDDSFASIWCVVQECVIFNLFIPAVFTEQYIESMGQSQNTAVLWPNGLHLLIYWCDNMFRPLQLGHRQVYKMFHTCSSFVMYILAYRYLNLMVSYVRAI
jgi:hypothetical protein